MLLVPFQVKGVLRVYIFQPVTVGRYEEELHTWERPVEIQLATLAEVLCPIRTTKFGMASVGRPVMLKPI